jgi:hypothetical protein
MSDKKGWGSSVLGLFVVRDSETAEGAAAPAVGPGTAEAAPADSDSAAAGSTSAAPMAPGGQVDFAAVYTAAGIDPEEQARVAKAAELLHALPSGSEPARQIVEASLKAFGVVVDKIIDAGDRETRALDAYVAAGAADTKKVLAESQQRIAQYEEEIQRIRKVMDERVAEQQAVDRNCKAGKAEVARVLEFFGHTTAPGVPPPIDPSERSS